MIRGSSVEKHIERVAARESQEKRRTTSDSGVTCKLSEAVKRCGGEAAGRRGTRSCSGPEESLGSPPVPERFGFAFEF